MWKDLAGNPFSYFENAFMASTLVPTMAYPAASGATSVSAAVLAQVSVDRRARAVSSAARVPAAGAKPVREQVVSEVRNGTGLRSLAERTTFDATTDAVTDVAVVRAMIAWARSQPAGKATWLVYAHYTDGHWFLRMACSARGQLGTKHGGKVYDDPELAEDTHGKFWYFLKDQRAVAAAVSSAVRRNVGLE